VPSIKNSDMIHSGIVRKNKSNMNIYQATSLISAFIVAGLGMLVFERDNQAPANRMFALFCLLQFPPFFAGFVVNLTHDFRVALFWTKLCGFLWLFATAALLHFLLVFAGNWGRLGKRTNLYLLYGSAFAVYAIGTISLRPLKEPWGYVMGLTGQPAASIVGIWSALIGVATIAIATISAWRSTGLKRKQLAVLALGFFVQFAVSGIWQIAAANNAALPFSPAIGITISALIIVFAIWRYELFTINPAKIAENIITTMLVYLTVFDLNGKILLVNKATSDILGYENKELLDQNVGKLIDNRLLKRLLDLPAGGEIIENVTTAFRKRDHHEMPVMLSGSTITDAHGTAVGIMMVGRDISKWMEAEEKVVQLVNYDQVTKLPNKLLLKERLQQSMQFAKRQKAVLAVICVWFYEIENVYNVFGDEIGDKLLTCITDRFSTSFRKADTIAKLGKEAFCIVAYDPRSETGIIDKVETFQEAFSRPFHIDKHEIPVNSSIGAALFPADGQNAEDLLNHAISAMHEARISGKGSFRFFEKKQTIQAKRHIEIEAGIKHALERKEFVVYYQPIIDLKKDAIVGAEALIRWLHPQRGLLLPAEFIPLAEENILIVRIGEFVLETVGADIRRWCDAGLWDPHVSVNFSPRQFQEKDLAAKVIDIFKGQRASLEKLEIEVTETLIIRNFENVLAVLEVLNQRGGKTATDDFGTGYSSLKTLKKLPVDLIKIDREFIRDVTTNNDSARIVKAVLSMAGNMDLYVVAEGVETEAQLEFLREQRCDAVQGFLFSRAVPAQDFEALLKQWPHAWRQAA